jgi:outer membrane protein TolC
LDTEFTVDAEPIPKPEEIDLAEARKQAASQRTEIRESQLQTKKAEVEVRRQRAEYIPDVSVHFSYLSFPNVNFVPENIMQAGFLLQWQPFDWGQKRHKTEALRLEARQAALTEQDTGQQVILDVNSKFRGLAEARALLDTVAVSQEAEREKLRVVTNRYGQKAALLSDVLQQEASVAQADADYRKALAAFWKAKADFDRALGRE